MTKRLSLIYYPDAIFYKKAEDILLFDDITQDYIQQMFALMYQYDAVGIGANMVGILKKIIVVDLQKNGIKKPYYFVNPTIISRSNEMQVNPEASLSLPGIERIDITRSKYITLEYLDKDNNISQFHASDYLACVIQHEIDYLHGITILDHISLLKKSIATKKILKYRKINNL